MSRVPSKGVASPPPSHATDAMDYVIAESKQFKAKELQEKMKMLEQMMGEFKAEQSFSLTDVEQIDKVIEESEQSILKAKENIAQAEKLKEDLKNLKFSIGDVAFHQEYGNVIVKGIELDRKHTTIKGYLIVGRKGEFRVEQNTLLPLNETTKVLYGR